MLMKELYEIIMELDRVADKLGLTAEEFCDYLQKIATEPIEEQEKEIEIRSFKNG